MLLHDHLDGGVRPETVLELAGEIDYPELPADDESGLSQWFRDASSSGSLERYLRDLRAHGRSDADRGPDWHRVAREAAEDLAADGVVYAEVRWAPEQHTEGDLGLDQVVDAVLTGFREGEAAAAARGQHIRVGAIVTAMRHAARSREIAELAVAYRDRGVVGFDIAGAEAGFPPTRHLDAFEYLRRENFHFTIHAGEAFGLPSIWEAIQWCGTDRLGHGVRIVDDIAADGALGRLAQYVRDKRIPLEMCPSSNVQTGAAKSIAEHPIGELRRRLFRVTVNTDNRLMSATSMTGEMAQLVERLRLWLGRSAVVHAQRDEERVPRRSTTGCDLINNTIKPGYAALMA